MGLLVAAYSGSGYAERLHSPLGEHLPCHRERLSLGRIGRATRVAQPPLYYQPHRLLRPHPGDRLAGRFQAGGHLHQGGQRGV